MLSIRSTGENGKYFREEKKNSGLEIENERKKLASANLLEVYIQKKKEESVLFRANNDRQQQRNSKTKN